jgi:hypothetical protein
VLPGKPEDLEDLEDLEVARKSIRVSKNAEEASAMLEKNQKT